jgi:glycosyltransferase involved in cell wall biosynthesis
MPSLSDSMDLVLRTESLPPEFWWEPGHPVRGTEEFYVESARHLHRIYPKVVIEKDPPYAREQLDSSPERTLCLGAPRGSTTQSALVIDCNPRSRSSLPSRKRVIWSNLFGVSASMLRAVASAGSSTIVCGVSHFHLEQLDPGGADGRVRFVPHGVDKARYASDGSEREAHVRRTGRRLALFSSSPDRGMDHVLRLAERLAAEGVDLLLSRYPDGRNNPLRDEQLVTYYKTAHYWLHPGLGQELFCLAGAKAQAAGCCPIIRGTAALAETVQTGFRLPAKASIDDWADFVIESVRRPMPVINAEHLLTWGSATQRLADVLEEA